MSTSRVRQSVIVFFALVVLFLSSWPACATEAVLLRKSNLRRDPSSANLPLRILIAGDEVELIDTNPKNGWYHIRDEDGQEGWLWGKSLRIVPEAPGAGQPAAQPEAVSPAVTAAISPQWDKPAPNQTQFENADGPCGPGGDGGDTPTNLRKNRTDVPPASHPVTWQAVAGLPYPKAPKARQNWTPAQLKQIEPIEGVAVSVIGYLVALKPQVGGSGESTNCHATHPAEVDWHMALVEKPGDGEKTAIVVETTPRVRQHHPRWTPQALQPWLNHDQPVRISGWTMLDPEHTNHIGKYRSTLWEIHPITKIEVSKDAQWIDLDDLP